MNRSVGSRFLALALVALAALPAWADQPRRTSLRDQVLSADCIVHGKVLSSKCSFEHGRIYTCYRVSSFNTIKGGDQSEIQVKVPGGEIGLVAYIVPGAPHLMDLEEVILFLHNEQASVYTLDGISSGLYRVVPDSLDLPYVVPNVPLEEPLLSADGYLLPGDRPLTLNSFIERISHYLGRNVDQSGYLFQPGKAPARGKRKSGPKAPLLSAGNVQAGYSRTLGRPIDIFWDLSRDYGPVKDGKVRWYFNPDSIAGKSPYHVTPDQVLDAVKWSFDQWGSVPTARIKYEFAGIRTDITDHKLDLVNLVTFADSEYTYGVQKDAIASAPSFALISRVFVGPEGLDWDQDGRIDFPDFPQGVWEAGTILDCDVRWDVGGPYADLDFAVDNTPGALGVQGVFNHELGHFSGLVHSPIRDLGPSAGGANSTPTMFSVALLNSADWSGNPMNTLELDDRVSLSMLYPTPEFAALYGTIQGEVVRGIDGKPCRGNFVVALSLPQGAPYRSLNDAYHRAKVAVGVFSDQQGRFRIQGLPPGDYVVGLQPMDDVPPGTNRYAYNTLVSGFADIDFIWDEFFNGQQESSQESDPFAFEPVTVSAGGVTGQIRLITNVYPQGRQSLRRLFGERDYFLAPNILRTPYSPYSSTDDLVARKLPQVFDAPYRIVSATCDFASTTAPPEGLQVIWPSIVLAVADSSNPGRPDLEHPLAVIRNFAGDGTLLTTDPLPFAYPVTVDRPGELWLVVQSPDGRLNAHHNIDILGAGQDELQVDESFVSFDRGASFASVMNYGISWRMGVVVEGTSGKVPLAGPRLVKSEWLSAQDAIRLHFSALKSITGGPPERPSAVRLRYVYRTQPYPPASPLRQVEKDPSTGAFAFTLVKASPDGDSTVYRVESFLPSPSGDRLTGTVQAVSGPPSPPGGQLVLNHVSGRGSSLYYGIWAGTFGGGGVWVKMVLRADSPSLSGVLVWPDPAPAGPDTSLVFESAAGDSTVLIPRLPSNPAGFRLTAFDDQGRTSPESMLGLGLDPFEPNDRIKDATPLFPSFGLPEIRHGLGAVRAAVVATKDQDDLDYYRFAVRQGDSVVVDVDAVSARPFDPASSLDAYVDVFDSTGVLFRGTDNVQVFNDDENGLDPFAAFVSPRDATCFLRVLDAAVAYGDRGSLTGFNAFYELRVSILPRKGDVINDRVIGVDDVLAALDIALGAVVPDQQGFFAADMDNNRLVNFQDVAAVFRRALFEPVAVAKNAPAALAGAAAEPVRVTCRPASPGNWIVSVEKGQGRLGALMLAFETSARFEAFPTGPAARLARVWARHGPMRLYVIVELDPAREEEAWRSGDFLRLTGPPSASLSLLTAQAGCPGLGESATFAGSAALTATPPDRFSLDGNAPNPFNPSTTISYAVPAQVESSTVQVRLDVFDLRGHLLRTLVNGPHSAGKYSVVWDGKDSRERGLPSGVYFCRLQAEGFSAVRKMVLIK